MGIYYAAVDWHEKKRIEPPKGKSIKSPGIFHPKNPFPQMVIMMNSNGYDFSIENDFSTNYYEGIMDITEEVYAEYLSIFPCAKEFYEN